MINTIFLVLLVCTISLNAQWEIINDGDTTLGYINDIDFFNEKIGWIECDFELLLTIDGGNTWLSVHSFKPEGEYSARFGHPPNIKDAAFINDSIGWYIYKDSLYQTKNRGKIWELAFESEIKKIQTLNDSIIIVANKNELKKSFDGGNTWISLELEIAGVFG